MMRKTNATLMAARIITKLGSMFQPAREISIDELLSKCKDREELEFFYHSLCEVRIYGGPNE